MSLAVVYITEDVFFTCLSHALTTEKEEVMGLLLGDIEKTSRGDEAHIAATCILRRSDKRIDRVEISPEQLTAGMAEADKISEQLKKTIRVIGWYHSHPHITVNPSHVDVQTQANYQMMDKGFVGLIFSCFNQDAAMAGRIQVTAFQSANAQDNHMAPDSPSDFSIAKKESASNGRLEGVEVPLFVKSAPGVGLDAFSKLVQLQEILFGEEKAAFQSSLSIETGQNSHPLLHFHSNSVYQKSVARLLELETLPLLSALHQRHQQNKDEILRLKEQKQLLEQLSNKRVKK
eukprot:TRINITY_DN2015_c0_g2_i2.p1 TRINITY_DN2015_c0_g2~~TRINITY_DN2015_c0_g2_i2.p1  ORF type:complete len:289 (-),score=45.53 TRINITY_DN2015_c0_g2_i2:69-935(-)